MSEEGTKRTIINTCALEAVDTIIKDLDSRSAFHRDVSVVDEAEMRMTWAAIVVQAIRKAAGEE